MAVVQTVLKGIKSTGFNLGDAANIGFGALEYNSARKEGDSRGLALAKTVGSTLLGEFLGIYSLPIFLAPAGIDIAKVVWEHKANEMSKGYAMAGKLGSGHFNMTEAGYTMRQRSINAIRSNGTNIQSALGNEARQYFR